MARDRLLVLGAGALLVSGVAVAATADPRAGFPEFLFGTVLALAALAAIVLLARARRALHAQRDRDRQLAGTPDGEVARRAGASERSRLAGRNRARLPAAGGAPGGGPGGPGGGRGG